MQFIDILRTQSMDSLMQVQELWTTNGKTHTRRTGIFKVGNLKWDKLRHYEYKNVAMIYPCFNGKEKYLFVQVDDKEKCFYNRK